MRRIEVEAGKHPHFIGAWFLDDLALTEGMIDFFEKHQAMQHPGVTAAGVNAAIKKSTDITIKPRDLREPGNAVLAAYFEELYACYVDYARQWPFLGAMLKEVDIGDFNIQRYEIGEHFEALHSERTSMEGLHRVLVWMTYLNDMPEGGQTRYEHYDLEIQPERGKTLIWPAEWTHAHAGKAVISGTKYIVTGWMHFPLRPPQESIK